MEPNQVERPKVVREEHLVFLDALRESGVTNMFGAGSYLDANFPELGEPAPPSFHSSAGAREILAYWMKTFAGRHGEMAERRALLIAEQWNAENAGAG